MSHEWCTFAECVLVVVWRVANVDVKRIEDLPLFVVIIVTITYFFKHNDCMLEVRFLMVESEHENIVTVDRLHKRLISFVTRFGTAARCPNVTVCVDFVQVLDEVVCRKVHAGCIWCLL